MSNLGIFNDIYANLAESAYNGRPNPFPRYQSDNEMVDFDFSLDWKDEKGNVTQGGKNLPNDGKVYLQPDPTLKITDKTTSLQIPKMNGGYETQTYITGEKQKGLLTDSEAGYNSYFVTDTPKLNSKTKDVYFVTRGSDSYEHLDSLIDDWIMNDANFALRDAYIPQAKLATAAMTAKIDEMRTNAKNAKMNVTGHSLGTMISIQAVANLPEGYVDSIGKVA